MLEHERRMLVRNASPEKRAAEGSGRVARHSAVNSTECSDLTSMFAVSTIPLSF